jgi:glycolate oxidase FAD binding subunit
MSSVIEHFQSLIGQAAASKQTLRIQGGNSKSFYGETATSANVLDTRAHTGIVSYEPSELVVTVRAGTPLAELEAVLNGQGQCLAFEPPHFSVDSQSHATVGGMVACGLAGPARANVGGVRDHLLGVQLLNGKGEWLTFGGQVMKNVAGYDVSRVMAGSMGTLGVITDVSLKVLPQAPAEATLVCHLPQDKALAMLQRWGAQPLPLSASCWVHDTSTQPAQDLLFVRLRGAVAAVESAVPRMCADVLAWAARRRHGPNAGQGRLVGMPRSTLALLHAPCTRRGAVALERAANRASAGPALCAADRMARGLAMAVGAAVGCSRIARCRCPSRRPRHPVSPPLQAPSDMPQVFSPLPAAQQRIQRQLQHQFDPHGVFNTGRLGLS